MLVAAIVFGGLGYFYGYLAAATADSADASSIAASSLSDTQRAQQNLEAQQSMASTATWMLAVSALGVLLIGWTLRATYQMLVEARDTTDAAWESENTNRKIGERQSRAYVFVRQIEVLNFLSDRTSECILKFELRNTGRTPAHDVQFTRRAFVRLVDEEHIPSEKTIARSQKLYLPSGESVFPSFHFQLHHQQKIAILNGTAELIFRGVVQYRDCFGTRRLLTFNYVMDRYLPLKNKPNSYGFSLSEDHNRAN